MLYIIHDVIMF